MFPTTEAVQVLLSDADTWIILIKLAGLIIIYIAGRRVQDTRLRGLAIEAVEAVEEAAKAGMIPKPRKFDEAVAHVKSRAWFTPVATASKLVLQATFRTEGAGASSKPNGTGGAQ